MSIPIPDELLSNPLVKAQAMRLSAEQVDYHPARSFKAAEVASFERKWMLLTSICLVQCFSVLEISVVRCETHSSIVDRRGLS